MKFYQAIYLSPHLDDVALSCGGQIYEQTAVGKSILIVTVTAGDPPNAPPSDFVQELHERWALPNSPVAHRRAEDIAACRILGADYLHWDIPDCIYRHHPVTSEPFYVSRADIFGEIHPAERENYIPQLAAQMATLPPSETIYAPLSIGHHVDHQITRLAAEQCFGRLHYYEDYPYVGKPGTLETLLTFQTTWQTKTVPLSEAALQAKMEAIAAFASQISTFFKDLSDLEQQIRQFTKETGGERVWAMVNDTHL